MRLAPIIFCVGPNAFLQSLTIDDVRGKLFPNGSGGLNDDTFDCKQKKLAEALDLANTLPMMAKQRLIVLRNAHTAKDKALGRLIEYIENPAPETVLLALAEKLDKRTRLYKLLQKKKLLVAADEPRPNEIPTWVDRRAKAHKIEVAPSARRMLADAVGTDLALLDQEIEKLALYIHPKTKLDDTDVAKLVQKTAGDNVFEWTDQVMEGRFNQAIETFHFLSAEGKPALVLLAMLIRHVRILVKARHHLEARTTHGALASILGVPPFTISKYMNQAKRTIVRKTFNLSR